MKKTHITFILDSSGSMAKIEDDTKGGYNAFLKDQRQEEGSATVTLYDFDTIVDFVYQGHPIEDAPELTNENYTPAGQTALHDAIYTAIAGTDKEISTRPPSEQPDNVIFVVLTDGKENASETPQTRVREQVEYHQKEMGWEFLFIGANQDAALTADHMGIDANRSLNMSHSGEGTRAAYESTSDMVSQARREGSTGGYDDEARRKQEEARDS